MVYPDMAPSLLKVAFYILLLLLLLLLLSFHVDHAMSTNDYIDSRCSITTNYTDGSAFEVIMCSLFSTFTNDPVDSFPSFYKATLVNGSDTVYGLVQCRSDIGQDICKKCISNSTQQVIKYCPNAMDVIVWYEKCQLRYSNTNFFGHLNVKDYGSWNWIEDKMEHPKAFNEKLGSLLKNLTDQATTVPNSMLSMFPMSMFATGNITYDDLQTIYRMVQCTGYSRADCKQCLNGTRFRIPTTCHNAHGCKIATGSCHVRYDMELFYGTPATPKPKSNSRQRPSTQSSNSLPPRPSPSPLPPPSDSSPPSNGASNTMSGKKHMYIIIVISVLMIVALITCLICGFYWGGQNYVAFRERS
ncbi:cysteine-rich repeat secretory protein 38-like [Nymphaea colorata]|uniref:cysteine-rich repeat secretory protein 38-like n=1 Tax=Nymphaea colorata TaxID=210225 RepID=UPI00214EE1E0|nr:cysteine-rich repeat secretory protein 38-like [Nymphaea colorata]